MTRPRGVTPLRRVLLGLGLLVGCDRPPPVPAGEPPTVTSFFTETRFRLRAATPPLWRTERVAAGQDDLVLLEHEPVAPPGGPRERPACAVYTRPRGAGDLEAATARLLAQVPFVVTRKALAEDDAVLGLRGAKGLALEGQRVTQGPKGTVDNRALVLVAQPGQSEVAIVCSASAAAYPKVLEDFRILLRSYVTW